MGERFERNGEKKMKQLYELSRKFPKDWIKKAPKGKFGNYVPHPVITQRLLEVCGPFDWEVVELIRQETPQTSKRRCVITGCGT